ncbi:MAG: mscL [Gemmatimonadetes bacterium]|jgi:large conductance mechanosensitive channel|nr:mscL [Gemmatimonadota bacterium]
MWRDFKAFLLTANVLTLALAVVIGAALAKVVTALVEDIIMPVVGYAVPGGAWRTFVWEVGSVKLAIGDFAGAIVDFFVIGFVVWRISRAFIRKADDAPARSCQFCRMAIDDAATRCPHCTSQLAGAMTA